MISKWFIGVKAKSKGFYKGWGYSYHGRDNSNVPRASFTKQCALATSYATEQEALDGIEIIREKCRKLIKTNKQRIALYTSYLNDWHNLTHDEKIKIIDENNIIIQSKSNGFYRRIQKDKAEYDIALDSYDWTAKIKTPTDTITCEEAKLKYIDEHLIVREVEIEIKFMDREKRKIKWSQRSDNQTASNYCNCCGGAVPGIPQLTIGRGYYGKYPTVICAICMVRLAEEAKIQAGKIPEEIMEHYQADRFIREMG